MAPHFAKNVPKDLADKFDEVVAEGPANPIAPFSPPRPGPRAEEKPAPKPDREVPDNAIAALREAFDELREDFRQGMAATAQTQFDALVPLRALLEDLSADVKAVRDRLPQGADSSLPLDALREELRKISAQLGKAAPAAAAPPDLGALRSQLDLLRQELQRDRGHRDALRSSVLDAVGSMRTETANVRAALDRAAKDGGGKATAAELTAIRLALAELRSSGGREKSAVGGVSVEVVRAIEQLRRELGDQLRERDGREADIETLVAGIDAGIKAVRQSITDVLADDDHTRLAAAGAQEELVRTVQAGINAVRQSIADGQAEDQQARQAATDARRDLMRTLEAFHDELVEQWRERKVFEASVPPVLEDLRRSVADGVSKLSAGIAFLPAAIEAQQPAPAPLPASPDEELLREVAALRDELADRAGQMDEFLRTAVAGANRWFVNMRNDLFQRIDEFGVASTNGNVAEAGDGGGGGGGSGGGGGGGNDDVVAAIDVVRAEVRELYAYLTMLDSNLQSFHDALVQQAAPVRKAAKATKPAAKSSSATTVSSP